MEDRIGSPRRYEYEGVVESGSEGEPSSRMEASGSGSPRPEESPSGSEQRYSGTEEQRTPESVEDQRAGPRDSPADYNYRKTGVDHLVRLVETMEHGYDGHDMMDYLSDEASADEQHLLGPGKAKKGALLNTYHSMSSGKVRKYVPLDEEEEDCALPFNYASPDSILPQAPNKEAAGFDDDALKHKELHRFQRGWKWNWMGVLLNIVYLVALGFYAWVRVTKTLDLGAYRWYGILVLTVEMMGATTTITYGINLLKDPVHEPLQPDPEHPGLTLVQKPYHVRVLIPTYKETVELVSKVVKAAYDAALPRNVERTIYVCDDGCDPKKRAWFKSMGPDIVYISGRKKPEGEMNGKSSNLNNCLTQIYPVSHELIPDHEVVCIFDADQVANPDFFIKTLPLFDAGDDVGMVLSPQAFHNLSTNADIFNHSNIQFWEYAQHGYDAMGFISCTGTNFLVRANCFAECGWSPTYTLTEDYALGMEMKRRKWQCRYVEEYLAIGEAPDQVRNCFQQRSRWCKGHFQIVLSAEHCPFWQPELSIAMRFMYCAACWSYVCGALATPMFIAIPIITIWGGIFPIVVSWWVALALTAYMGSQFLLLNYVRRGKMQQHWKALWFANIANQILWWTFVKACWRAAGSTFGKAITFKTTLKGAQRMFNSTFGDLWVPVASLIGLTISFAFGLKKVLEGPSVVTTLSLSLVWIIYSMIAPYLIVHYAFVGKGRTLEYACKVGMVLSTAVAACAIILLWFVYPPPYNYGEVLSQGYMFLEAERVGQLPPGNRIPWRGDSLLIDGMSNGANKLGYPDLSGGWMNGGMTGGIKLTIPTAMTTSFLAWGLLAFPEGYESAPGNQTKVALDNIKWGADYLMKTVVKDKKKSNKYSDEYNIIYQVGNLTAEMGWWGRPEDMNATNMPRPAYVISTWNGTSDLGGQMVAAWAAASLAWRNEDSSYADTLMVYAMNLYGSITRHRGRYSASYIYPCAVDITKPQALPNTGCARPDLYFKGNAVVYYNSTSYRDDLAWAAAWMYKATGDNSYLGDAYSYWQDHVNQEGDLDKTLVTNWDNMIAPASVLLANLTDDTMFHYASQNYLKGWLCSSSGTVIYTPRGRAVNLNMKALGGTMNAALLAAIYGEMIRPYDGQPVDKYSDGYKSERYTCWTIKQMRYVLGDVGSSLVTGIGQKPPSHIQDKAASCPRLKTFYNLTEAKAANKTASKLFEGWNDPPCNLLNGLYSPEGNPNTLVGGLVEFSRWGDSLQDLRTSNDTRVAVEHQSGFIGALAGLAQAPNTYDKCLQGFGVLQVDKRMCLGDLIV